MIQQRHYGWEHPEVTKTLRDLTVVCRIVQSGLRDYAKLERFLKIQEQHHGGMAKRLFDLGIVYCRHRWNTIVLATDFVSQYLPNLYCISEKTDKLKECWNAAEQHYGSEHLKMPKTMVHPFWWTRKGGKDSHWMAA